MAVTLDHANHVMEQLMYDSMRPNYVGNSSSINVTPDDFVYNPNPYAIAPTGSGRNEVNTKIKTVRVKAGFLGQVTFVAPNSLMETIVWESEPKKTLAKADKAARKAQLRAAQRSFE